MWNRMRYMVVFSHLDGISNVAILLSLIVPGLPLHADLAIPIKVWTRFRVHSGLTLNADKFVDNVFYELHLPSGLGQRPQH